MAGGKRLDRRGSSPIWFVMLAIVLFFLYSVAVAAVHVNDCGVNPKTWRLFPPSWVCHARPGFG